MNRRTYLSLGVGIGTVLAGCTTNTSSSDEDHKKTQKHFEKAATALQNAEDEVNSESDKFTNSSFQNGGVDVDPTAINGYLNTANTELDKAEKYATNDQQEKINAVRGYIRFIRKTVSFLDIFAEGYSKAYNGFTYFQSERYEEATSELKSAETSLSEADDTLAVSQSLSQELNTEILNEINKVQVASIKSSLSKLDEFVSAIQALVKGMRFLSQGMSDFTAANTSMENESYDDAEANFRAASEDFSSSYSTFKAKEESAPTEIKNTFIKLTCYSKAVRDASNHFANAMEAIQNDNDERAETEVNKAKDDLDQCNFSSS